MRQEKLIVLGTGNCGALESYNTCFLLGSNNNFLLVDSGGGNRLLSNLKSSKIDPLSIHNVFVSHNHIDHIIGIIWLIRIITISMRTNDNYNGNLNIYSSNETSEGLSSLCNTLLSDAQKEFIGNRIIFNQVEDREEKNIMDYDITFIDIKARKDKQFGFKLKLHNGKNLIFSGDEPLDESLYDIAKGSDWLLHEAFCLDSEKEMYHPHEKGHCTVKEASEIARNVETKNLILWHTKDNNLKERQKLYSEEAMQSFQGSIFIPNDLDVIDL